MTVRLFVALALFSATAAWTNCYAADAGCTATSIPEVQRGLAGAPTVEVYGVIAAIQGARLTMTTRDGKSVSVDATEAEKSERSTALEPGFPIVVLATLGSNGVLRAQSIGRAKARAAWAPDCFEKASPEAVKAAPTKPSQ